MRFSLLLNVNLFPCELQTGAHRPVWCETLAQISTEMSATDP